VPKIVIATEPTELIVIDGEPKFKSLGGDLLYVDNSESDVFMEIATQAYYVVLSGRWYRSQSMQGPWEYVKSDKLPAAFAMIPEDHEKGTVLPFVAGTNPANEAVLDAQVPQTAAVKRSDAKLEVTYDGEPKFEPVPETSIQMAVNTSKTVLLINKKYYCCDNAIWFVGDSPKGPWTVCDNVPSEVQDIPPESAAYNVKYVYVYDSTPEIVYVGYTPAYVGCYPYYGSVVWGTGWYYHPWVSPYYYYPRPCTWGFHVNYNPWTGWSCGMSWSNGWVHFSVGFGGYGGWWGPAGYGWRPNYPYHGGRPVYVNRPININTGDINVGGGRGDQVAHHKGGNNLYNRPSVQPAIEQRPSSRPGGGASTQPATRPAGGTGAKPSNNMYVDRDGNVMQRDNNGNWSQRDNGQWKPVDGGAKPSTRPSTPSAGTRPATPGAQPATPTTRPATPSTQQMNRDYSARSRGAQQSQNYSRSQSRPASRPSGGGGRRR
jgi:hypothetical protein